MRKNTENFQNFALCISMPGKARLLSQTMLKKAAPGCIFLPSNRTSPYRYPEMTLRNLQRRVIAKTLKGHVLACDYGRVIFKEAYRSTSHEPIALL